MNSFNVICDTGKTWTTSMNASLDEAKRYFIGQTFTDEDFETGTEVHHKAINVVEVQS